MKRLKGYLEEMYSFIPKTRQDIMNSNLQTKEKIAKLYDLIQAQTDNKMPDPLAIDFKQPMSVKVARKLQYEVDIRKLAKETGLSVTIGNGSRGNTGASNRGLAFESYLSKDLGLYIMNRSTEAAYKYPKFIKDFTDRYLNDKKDIEIVDEGGLNKPRPLIFQSGNVYVGGTGKMGVQDIGKVVTDITVKTDKGPMYLSLKMGSTVTFFNSGVGKILMKSEIEKGEIKNADGLLLLDMLGIDPTQFVNVFRSYKPTSLKTKVQKGEVDVTNKIDKTKLTNFLASGVGYGYHLIHAARPDKDDITDFFLSSASDTKQMVTPTKVVVQYPIGGIAKRVDIVIDTPKFSFKVNIRNKQGGIYPTHIMCDYKIKH